MQNYKISVISFFVIINLCSSFAEQHIITWLPASESEAVESIYNGTLDSTLWNLLKKYYIQPISVPDGELLELTNLFPDLHNSVPSNDSSLIKYKPWDRKSIKQFFKDYPDLIPFEPLLSFNSTVKQYGKLELSNKGTLPDNSYTYIANVMLKPVKFIRCSARLSSTEDLVELQKRTVTIIPSSVSEVELGNFNSSENGLFFGYFPDSISTKKSILNNLCIGAANNWNGIDGKLTGLKINERIHLSGEIFYHQRLTEIIAASFFNTKIRRLTFGTGVSCVKIPGQNQMYGYIHLNSKIELSRFYTEFTSGLDLSNKTFPLSIECIYNNSHIKSNLKVVLLPNHFNAPRSRYETLSSLKDLPDNGIKTILAFTINHQLSSLFTYKTSFEMMMQDQYVMFAGTTICGTLTADRIDFTMSVINKRNVAVPDSNVNMVQCNAGFNTGIHSNIQTLVQYTTGNKTGNLHCRLVYNQAVKSNLTLEPSVLISKKNAEEFHCSCCLKQRLQLSENVYSQFKLLIPVLPSNKKGEFHVEIRMGFLF